ncbi:hypothetical protein MRX96_004832 [Rhipicephalus microplus]
MLRCSLHRQRHPTPDDEARNIKVCIGDVQFRPKERLTRFTQAELIMVLSRDVWFDRVVRADLRSSAAIACVLDGFYKAYGSHCQSHLIAVNSRAGENCWWTPQLVEERA